MGIYLIYSVILTLNVLYNSESFIEIKIKLHFYFHFFVVPQKAFIKPFEAPQTSVKIKI